MNYLYMQSNTHITYRNCKEVPNFNTDYVGFVKRNAKYIVNENSQPNRHLVRVPRGNVEE